MADIDPREKRLTELRDEHRKLDTVIAGQSANGTMDQIEIQRLKKRKLQIKDEITRLQSSILPDIIA